MLRSFCMDCTIEVCDLNEVRHSVEIEADALYEAVVKGVAALRKASFPVRVTSPSEVFVRVKPPETLHVVQFAKVEAWLKSSSDPATQVLKGRLLTMLGENG